MDELQKKFATGKLLAALEQVSCFQVHTILIGKRSQPQEEGKTLDCTPPFGRNVLKMFRCQMPDRYHGHF
jgi:hypothetical protein